MWFFNISVYLVQRSRPRNSLEGRLFQFYEHEITPLCTENSAADCPVFKLAGNWWLIGHLANFTGKRLVALIGGEWGRWKLTRTS